MKAKNRWLKSEPDNHLTWGKEIPGQPFIKKVLEYINIDSNTSILEVGPGYGRLLKAIFDLNLDFKVYYGLDISPRNIGYLKEEFRNRGLVHFLEGDIEVIKIDAMFDVMISSLTFKHFFPSFEKALQNVFTQLAGDGIVLFD